MTILILVLLLSLGFVAVIKGADFMVDGAAALARKYGISEMAIGLTVVAFGTSAPELAVNLQADDAIVFGNIIGSNNFNLLGVLGITGLICPLILQKKTIRYELPISLGVLLIFYWFCNTAGGTSINGELSQWEGIVLLVFFLLFLFYVMKSSSPDELNQELSEAPKSVPLSIGMVVLGLVGLIGGGKLIVHNATELARMVNMSETMIGLTVVSFGTSLPELVTSIVAARKGKTELAVGNILGSNIFNVLLIMGLSSTIKSRHFESFLNFDIGMTIAGVCVLILFLGLKKTQKLNWKVSLFMLLIFVLYYAQVMNRELSLI